MCLSLNKETMIYNPNNNNEVYLSVVLYFAMSPVQSTKISVEHFDIPLEDELVDLDVVSILPLSNSSSTESRYETLFSSSANGCRSVGE